MSDFPTLKFCGATVRNIQSSLGWNGQKGNVRVALVEDTAQGDLFMPPLPRTPAYINIPGSAFEFYGLLQSYQKERGFDGNPVYSVTLEDPRDILDGTTVILSNYNGPTSIVPNLINVYGYWENLLGFGGSEVNESGIPWYKVFIAIQSMTIGLATPYGGPLNWDSYYYAVDLTELPVPPLYYRVGGGYEMSLLTLIQQICDDGMADFFVELKKVNNVFVIKVRVASKRYEPPLGSITQFINEQTELGSCVRSGTGMEGRNETNSSFCVGAPVQFIYEAETDAITPYWGLDIDGNPIIGSGSGLNHTFLANSQEVADIVGDVVYSCSVAELCAVLSPGAASTWEMFMRSNRPADYDFMRLSSEGVPAAAQAFLNGAPLRGNDLKDFRPQALGRDNNLQVNTQAIKQSRMYEFLRKLANDYMGKQFLVRIPFLLFKNIPETNQIVFSVEPTDSGYMEQDGDAPLDIPFLLEDFVRTEDGKYSCFVRFDEISGLNLSKLGLDNFVFDTDTDSIYVKATVNPKPVFSDPITPCVIVTLSNQVFAKEEDWTGIGTSTLLAFLHGNNQGLNLAALHKNKVGGVTPGAYMSPPARQPVQMAIPFRSNIQLYGPWYAIGSPGKVQYINDTTLAPWNYGGHAGMYQAGIAKVVNAFSNYLYQENGFIEYAGMPEHNLGDTLETNGANVTDIQINYGVDRISCSYRFQTYSQRFGVFGKDNDRRMQRMVRFNNQLRNNLRASIISNAKLNKQVGSALQSRAEYTFLQHNKPAHLGKSPHGFIAARLNSDGKYSAQIFKTNTSDLATALGLEVVGSSTTINNTEYLKTGGMSLDGLVLPFSTDVSGNSVLPKYQPLPVSFDSNVLTRTKLDTFRLDNKIELLVRGTGQNSGTDDLHNGYLSSVIPSGGTRPIALRSQLTLVGDGYDLLLNPNNVNSKFVGPTDFLFDKFRGVWTMHDLMVGRTLGSIGPSGVGTVSIYMLQDGTGLSGTTNYVTAYNFYSATISANRTVTLGYFMHLNRWCIISADC